MQPFFFDRGVSLAPSSIGIPMGPLYQPTPYSLACPGSLCRPQLFSFGISAASGDSAAFDRGVSLAPSSIGIPVGPFVNLINRGCISALPRSPGTVCLPQSFCFNSFPLSPVIQPFRRIRQVTRPRLRMGRRMTPQTVHHWSCHPRHHRGPTRNRSLPSPTHPTKAAPR